MKNLIDSRRTFAIISHPDAGKTTLTEKLLLFGGAIRLAGSIKGRKAKTHATSDWMEIEKQRGISVTSSVMQFQYRGHHINILDTPGHQDFSEDTYRTLTAADSAVMLIDVAKGIEAQTIKLFEVCRMRGIPIFTFVNKMDRYGKEPLEILEEIEKVLGMRSCPMNWPIGMGPEFVGVYNRFTEQVELFTGKEEREFFDLDEQGLNSPTLKQLLGNERHQKLLDDIELLDIAGDPYDEHKIRSGELTPVFFGSAITNFGIQTFLEQFLDLAPHPTARKSSIGLIDPAETPFSGFIFKIQANMNPAHRDRVAFLRICSGKFERGMTVTLVRNSKKIKLSQPQQFLAQDREIVDEAYPGDIIGLFDPGLFQIGDTLCLEGSFQYEKLPTFSPEHFAKVTVKDTLKHKQFQKGVDQLAEEGAIQVYKSLTPGSEGLILGAVGQLQFEVFEHRLQSEYGATINLQHLPYQHARWLSSDEVKNPQSLQRISCTFAKDKDNNLVVLFENDYALRWMIERNPTVKFYEVPVTTR